MEALLSNFGTSQVTTLHDIISGCLLTFVLTVMIATVYRWTYTGLSYSRSFVHTQILGGLVTCFIIMAIGDNLARGLGIMGTLAIIRFRTPIRDPRDIIFLFACLGAGIGCGAHVYSATIVGTLFFSVAALYLHRSPFASRREYEGLLRFLLPANSTSENIIQEVFKQFCSSSTLIAMREAVQGDCLEFSYQVRLIDPSYQSDLLTAVQSVADATDISLMMQRATVEI